MKLMILDGNSIINRAFYGVRLLTTRDGLYTNAIFGFLNIMQRMQQEEKPDALCVAFDLHAPTFRHLQYAGYKATRHGMPEELAAQMPLMKQVLAAMNIPIFECEGWEADDVIGTVARRCSEEKWNCVIVTGDRDSLQLVDDYVCVKLITSKAGQTLSTNYTPAVFEQEYGFPPIRLIDLKALMGDSSDNIPGVAGVGPKTATELLCRFGTLQGVYENLNSEALKPKLREKLENARDMAFLSYDLATIRCSAPIVFSPENCRIQPPKRRALYDLFTKLEFQKLIDRYHLRGAELEEDSPEKQDVFEGECRSELVTDEARALALLDDFASRPFVTLAVADDFSIIAVDNDEQMSYFSEEALSRTFLCGLFSEKIKKAAHNVKPLMRSLLERKLPIDGFQFDTAVAAYLLDASRGKYALSDLTAAYLQFDLPKPDEGEESAKFAVLGSAASAVRALYAPLWSRLCELHMQELFTKIDFPLCRVLAEMEAAGVAVDRDALCAFGAMLDERIAACQQAIFAEAGEAFNINSTKALGHILFEKLQLPAVKKTKTGYSTGVEVLEKLKDANPIIPQIMEYRVLTKLKSTYADGLMKVIAPDGRIHTTFQNTVTATGRLSSTDPNLQNIPVRTELGSEIRKMFIPREGFVFVDADYSQIELRVLAEIADDKVMQAAFLSGIDFHTVTASQVFNVPVEEVTPTLRRNAKAVNFGIVYGISKWSLSEDLGVAPWEAEQYIESYLAKYSGVRAYMHEIVEAAKRDGYVTTLYGRRRYLPELKSSNYNIRSAAERIALNTPIQGTAADIIKLAMLRVSRALQEETLQAQLVLQVHDELIVECPAFEAELVMQILTREMQGVRKMAAPLIAEAKMGASWYEAK